MTEAHPPVCVRLNGKPVAHEPHFLYGTCDCLCPKCYDGNVCICPECKGAECPDNVGMASRDRK